jgi:hypothetical protein
MGSSSPVQLTSTTYCHDELLRSALLTLLAHIPGIFLLHSARGGYRGQKKLSNTKIDRKWSHTTRDGVVHKILRKNKTSFKIKFKILHGEYAERVNEGSHHKCGLTYQLQPA